MWGKVRNWSSSNPLLFPNLWYQACTHNFCVTNSRILCILEVLKPIIRKNIGRRINSIIAYLRALIILSIPGLSPTVGLGLSTKISIYTQDCWLYSKDLQYGAEINLSNDNKIWWLSLVKNGQSRFLSSRQAGENSIP